MEERLRTVVCGRPAAGKTQFAMDQTAHELDRGERVLVLSLDLSESAWRERMGERRGHPNLFIDDWWMSSSEQDMSSWDRIRNAVGRTRPGLVILDYLQRLPDVATYASACTTENPVRPMPDPRNGEVWGHLTGAVGPGVDLMALSQLPTCENPCATAMPLLFLPLPPAPWRIGFV
jgi:hypothetical protein